MVNILQDPGLYSEDDARVEGQSHRGASGF